jgi:hypothetical protein
MAISIRGSKEVDSFSINNKSFYLDVFYLDALSIKLHGEPYKTLEKSLQDKTKEYIRTVLLKGVDTITLDGIRERILVEMCADEYKEALKKCIKR